MTERGRGGDGPGSLVPGREPEIRRDEAYEERLDGYLELIRRWRCSLDLVGQMTESALRRVLVDETLLALSAMPDSGRLLDIGSGVGIPAVPLLLARPGLHGVLLEPRERRWAFLCEVVRALRLDAEVRREDVRRHSGGGYTMVTVRGVDPELWWCELRRLVAEGGALAWWTGEAKAVEWKDRFAEGRVVLSALPSAGRGRLLVWRRCST